MTAPDISFAPIAQSACLRTAPAGELTITEVRAQPGIRLSWRTRTEDASLVAMLDGSFTESFATRSITCEGSVAVFKPAGAVHADHYGPHGARFLVITLPSASVVRLHLAGQSGDGVVGVRHPTIIDIARRIKAECDRVDAYSELVLEGLILELTGTLIREHQADHCSLAPRWLRATRERLQTEFASRLTVAQLASDAGVHPDHLSRSFQQHYGLLIGEYVRHCRVRWAAEAIASTEIPLLEVATAAGFADQSEFTRRFRELMGTTPGRYPGRRALRHRNSGCSAFRRRGSAYRWYGHRIHLCDRSGEPVG